MTGFNHFSSCTFGWVPKIWPGPSERPAAVFFYANQHGSKVYFDKLGPPWSKNPCTDNPKNKSIAGHGPSTPPGRHGAPFGIGCLRCLLGEGHGEEGTGDPAAALASMC